LDTELALKLFPRLGQAVVLVVGVGLVVLRREEQSTFDSYRASVSGANTSTLTGDCPLQPH